MSDVLGSKLLHAYGTNHLKLFVFQVNDGKFALNLAKVREIIQVSSHQLVSLMGSNAPAFSGLIHVRGESIPAVSLFEYLSEEPATPEQEPLAIITEYNEKKTAFLIQDADFNLNVSWDKILPPESISEYGSVQAGFLLHDDQIIHLLDFERIRDDVLGPSIVVPENDDTEDSPPLRVLFAEDSPHVRHVVAKFLRSRGFEVTETSDGEAAWSAFQANPFDFDVVLSDIEMPRKDGTRLVVDIRHNSDNSKLPIVLMSSMTIEQNIQQYLEIGASAFVPKNRLNALVAKLVELAGGEQSDTEAA